MRASRSTTLAAAATLTLAGAASALAAGPLKGKTYQGSAPVTGISSEGHHRIRLYSGGYITLRVARSGRSVSVRFTSPWPVLYCRTQQKLHVQSTKAASISHGGSFTATIIERFAAGPGSNSITQVVTGRFSGRTVKGAIHTHAAECGGTSTYSARAH